MPMKTREFERLLIKHGFEAIRQAGSHRTYFNPMTKKTVIVPIHAREIPKGILHKMIKQAGINQD